MGHSQTAAALLLASVLSALPVLAASPQISEQSALDTPLYDPSQARHAALAPSAAALRERRAALIRSARVQYQAALKLPEQALEQAAGKGNRVAQLALAARYADEGNRHALTLVSGNAALSDAVRWYSLSASRGYPGSMPVDVLPLFPLRALR